MFVTNGKIIIQPQNKVTELKELAGQLETRIEGLGYGKQKFKYKAKPHPQLEVPEPVTVDMLKKACKPDIQLVMKAIGNEVITLQIVSPKEIKHVFSAEEKDKLGEDLATNVQKVEEIEIEKKQVNKQYSDEIAEYDEKIKRQARSFKQGHEMRTIDVKTQLDFEHNQKIFLDANTDEIVATEDLDANDFQMKMDYDPKFQPKEDAKDDKKKDGNETPLKAVKDDEGSKDDVDGAGVNPEETPGATDDGDDDLPI